MSDENVTPDADVVEPVESVEDPEACYIITHSGERVLRSEYKGE